MTALIHQKQEEKRTIEISIEKLSDILRYENERKHDFYKLYKQKSASKHDYYQQANRVLELENTLATQKNRLNELDAEKIQATQEYQTFITEFRRNLLDEYKKISDSLTQIRFELNKAEQRQKLMEIRSPINGVVQQLQTYTLGGVVTTAQTLMVVAPKEDSLEVEALISNNDVGFVKAGQDVVIKIDAFPYTRYGYITGKVKHISLDAIHDEKLGYVFATTILMDKVALNIEDKPVLLKQGMVVSAEIQTGKRSVMDYLLSPLQTTIDESLRER